MKSIILSLLFVYFSASHLNAQTARIDKVKFFEDTSILKATITTNIAKLFNKKNKTGIHFPARFLITLPDGTTIDDNLSMEVRGHFRKGYCYIPPLKIHFKSQKTSPLKTLGSLKLVSQCSLAFFSETYLLDEYLIYKIYNLLTNMSFRVRLLKITFEDSLGKKKPMNEYAFLMEDEKDLASRNNCTDWKKGDIGDQGTDRHQMTTVALFEYMIGNTDWSVFAGHNIKLLLSKTDSFQHFYPVPYDFDYSGFVNTNYATPDPRLNISSVRERVYRGYPRTIEELDEALEVFKNQKNNIYSLINNFQLLNSRDKKDLTFYLDQFFDLINHPEQVKDAFIRNARRD